MTGPLIFNPGRASVDELEATFVGRGLQLDALVRDLAGDATGPTRRQWMLVAPRGCGKSHFTVLVAERLRRDHGWDIVRMPEEHYQVASIADLLEQIVSRLNGGISPFAQEQDLMRVEERALSWLRARARDTARPLLVVIENLGLLFERQLRDRRSQARLRQILSVDPPFTLLATATGYVDATTSQSAPFYDFFQQSTLQDLSAEDARALIQARLRWDGLGGPRWEELEPRVDALYHFAGGNPRLLTLLYVILREGVSAELHAQLMKLLDDVSPYYQSRLKDISAQMERVLVALAIAGGPRTPTEIGQACRLPVNAITANLSKLQDERLVVPAGRKDGRSRRYEVTDRLFRIWLQMRESDDDGRQLKFLVDFYRVWYASDPMTLHELLGDAAGQFWAAVTQGEDLERDENLLQMGILSEAAPGYSMFQNFVDALERAGPEKQGDAAVGERLRGRRVATKNRYERAALDCVLAGWLEREGRVAESFDVLDAALCEAGPDIAREVERRLVRLDLSSVDSSTVLERALFWLRRSPESLELLVIAIRAASLAQRTADALRLLVRFTDAKGNLSFAIAHLLTLLGVEVSREEPDLRPVDIAISAVGSAGGCSDERWPIVTAARALRVGDGAAALLAAIEAWLPSAGGEDAILGIGSVVQALVICGEPESATRLLRRCIAGGRDQNHTWFNLSFGVQLTMLTARLGSLPPDLVHWLAARDDRRFAVSRFPAIGNMLLRERRANPLPAYAFLRDAGLLPAALPPYSSALRVLHDPAARDELSPEEREAVDLLLSVQTPTAPTALW